jgi:hypothetical protein
MGDCMTCGHFHKCSNQVLSLTVGTGGGPAQVGTRFFVKGC